MVAETNSMKQTETLTSDSAVNAQRINWRVSISVAILVAFIAFLLLDRLDLYPGLNLDEGAFLKVAKNYALTGHYADFSLGENRYTGAIISTGPTVILPIALLFKVFGPSIITGRLVAVGYTALLLLAIFALGTSLQGRRLGLAAIILVLCLPGIGFVYLGRGVFGEFPGLFFVLAGLWLWLRPGKRRLIDLIVVGFVFGCGAITKDQYAPIILGGIFISWMADIFWYRRNGPLYYIVPGVVAALSFAGWTYYVLFLLGAQERNVAGDIQLLRSTATNALFLFDSSTNNTNIVTLIQDNLFLIPATVYGMVSLLRRDEQEQRWSVLLIFLLISIVMYIFSYGYSRYEIGPQILGVLIIVRLVSNLTSGQMVKLQDVRNFLRGKSMPLAATITMLIAVLLAEQYLRPLYLQIEYVATSGTNAPYLVQQYLDANVPRDTVIATYESGMGVLTDHAYKFAPNSILGSLSVSKPGSEAIAPALYDFLFRQGAQYIVVGPFAESIIPNLSERLYPAFDLVFKADDYEVYRLKQETF